MFDETGRRCLGVGMVIGMFRVSANPLECWFSLDVFLVCVAPVGSF